MIPLGSKITVLSQRGIIASPAAQVWVQSILWPLCGCPYLGIHAKARSILELFGISLLLAHMQPHTGIVSMEMVPPLVHIGKLVLCVYRFACTSGTEKEFTRLG